MSYGRMLAEEACLLLGRQHVYVNAFHGVRSIHEGEADGAYEDGDRNIRVSPFLLVRSPRRVFRDLMKLSRGRWSAEDAAVLVRTARFYLHDRLVASHAMVG